MALDLEKILLAGIGSVAATYEKAVEVVEEMVKKGELTVKQGKALNEELKKKGEQGSSSDMEKKIDTLLAEIGNINKRLSELEKK